LSAIGGKSDRRRHASEPEHLLEGRRPEQLHRHRPFALPITRAMIETTKFLVERTLARIGYTQSDEISLVWHLDRYDSEAVIFDGAAPEVD
jgi:tRNA(His) 5'-end guanylyltransferase